MVQKLISGDFFDVVKSLPSKSIHLAINDLCYGVTKNSWDKRPDLNKMWLELLRVGTPNTAYVFTAQQPFATDIIISNRKMFRYDIIWQKVRASGFLNARRMPLRSHELILVFYKKKPTFNPQFTEGVRNHSMGKIVATGEAFVNNNYGNHVKIENDHGTRKFPQSILTFSRPHPAIHPTQKPVELFQNLIRTYSNEGDMVLDGFSGSGTTALAAFKEKRQFICVENEPKYYKMSVERLKLLTDIG